jgi:membrane protease YdiL (CAAX protease family)
MTPIDLTPAPNPQPLTPRSPFFDYADLFLFIGFCIPCLLIAELLMLGVAALLHLSNNLHLLLSQAVWYFLAFGALAALFRIRYGEPFWRSLGWRPISISTSLGAIVGGPALILGLSILYSALRTPDIPNPFEDMLGSTASIVMLGILAVVLGPVCEELAFRGFLMPLLIRSLGATGGIVLTGVLFGSAHGYEYQWSWQYMLLISLVGCAFGWARYKTQSTMTSTFMHMTFNLTQFAALYLRSRIL